MVIRRSVSFAAVAYRVGAVTVDQLREAYALSRARGESLDAVLRSNADPELIGFVETALARARVSCLRCGGRTDLPEGDSEDFVCRCGSLRLVAADAA